MGIDLKQYSTQSGLIKIGIALIGVVGWWFGKDMSQLMILYGAVSGVHGVVSDN